MIQQFGLMQEYHKRYLSDARKAFEKTCRRDGSGKDGLIHISVEDHDPKRAAELATVMSISFASNLSASPSPKPPNADFSLSRS